MASTPTTPTKALVIRGAIVTAITGLIHTLVVLGVLPLSTEAEGAIADVVDQLGTAVLIVWLGGAVIPSGDGTDKG
ncbi:hypothetical protein [Saccharothrix sp. ALI-22-I]|uniref:hypothetical protein n=1 Tax=Saccharothrix sp. ALI-22-I TaxID=1933778 RepID=UPI001179E8F5|nr:hypothetical protein [Saccharothrix sp. ALI-22-I]